MELNRDTYLFIVILIALVISLLFVRRKKPHQRKKHPQKSLVSAFVAGMIAMGSIWYGVNQISTANTEAAEGYLVKRVVDGDTFVIEENGEDEKIRLIGVDTPESVSPDESRNCEEGIEASQFTKDLLDGQMVYLEYDEEKTDRYGRTLAYVYLDEEMTDMLQIRLLEAGMADVMTVKPNVKYQNLFAETEEKARAEAAGFWAEDFWN